MKSEWQMTTLGELTRWVSGGTPSKARKDFWLGDIPWVSADSMRTIEIEDSELHISEAGLESGSKLAEKGTILLLVRGGALHNRVPIGVALRDVAFNQDVKAITPKDQRLRKSFLLTWLLGKTSELLGMVDFTGIGAGKLDTDWLQAMPFALPPLEEQDAIAEIFQCLQHRISQIERTSLILKGIATTLFKSWFVDFDPVKAKAEGREPDGMDSATADLFPGEFQDSAIGLIPRGWSVKSVGDLCDRVSMGPFGSDIKTDNFITEGVPLVRGKNLGDGFVDENFVYISQAKADQLRNANAFRGDIVITHRGTLGQVGLIPIESRFDRYVVSQSQMVLSVQSDMATPTFLYHFLISAGGQHQLLANTSQTGVPAISRPTTNVKAMRVPIPGRVEILESFSAVADSLASRATSNSSMRRTIADLRGALLPRLISGQLRVPEAEKMVEAVL
jgi:type I restriction enzyme S subunit